MVKIPEPVQELLKHLRSTGTGENKLAIIEQIGIETKGNKEVFLHEVNKQLSTSPATLAKMYKFIGVEPIPLAVQPEVDEPVSSTESSSEELKKEESKSKKK